MRTLPDFSVSKRLRFFKSKLAEILHNFIYNEAVGELLVHRRNGDVYFSPHYMLVVVHSGALSPSLDVCHFVGRVWIVCLVDFFSNNLLNKINKLAIFNLSDRVKSLVCIED